MEEDDSHKGLTLGACGSVPHSQISFNFYGSRLESRPPTLFLPFLMLTLSLSLSPSFSFSDSTATLNSDLRALKKDEFSPIQVGDLSSDFKLDAVKGHGSEDPEVGSINGGVHLILPERRAVSLTDRLFRGSQEGHGEIVSIPIGGDEKREHRSARKSGPLLSGTAYCISSCSMILLNKVVLSGYYFNAGVSLMFYQECINLISTIIVVLLNFSGVVTVEKLNWTLVRVWIPVNFEICKYCNGDHSEECDKYFNSTRRIIFVPETSELESVDCHVYDDYLF
ncbi:hypothetical protein ACFX1X_006175 [Malus domestica]